MKLAFLFPGQGAQYPGMAKDFVESFPIARQTFEEADDVLGRKISDIILNGPEGLLTETKNSQTGIYIASIAILRVVQDLYPELQPSVCAGLSLGEYTAATAAGILEFTSGLILVQSRGQFMNDACEATDGAMAVILGLESDAVEEIVREANLPNDLWVANFNCPGQVVISGTKRGIEAGSSRAKERGAKRVLPLQVHGAFHSGLMKSAEERLEEVIREISLSEGRASLVMNVPAKVVADPEKIRQNLIRQVTSPVRWEQGIREIEKMGVDLYIEMGPGKTLSGFNKRIGALAATKSIEHIKDLNTLEEFS